MSLTDIHLSSRRRVLLSLAALALSACAQMTPTGDPLPSWNDGAAKSAIVHFVRNTTVAGGPQFVPPEERIATFDQDGTLWVEQPIYTQVVFALDRVKTWRPQHPEWKTTEPFKTLLAGDRDTMAKFTIQDFEKIVERHALRHDGRRVQRRSSRAGWPRQASAIQAALYRAGLSADARGDALPARTASRPTSSPAAARTSFACLPSRSTACRPSK